eukprot:m.94805 g.94805  ORF g.94805 m.94805 type:complete len:99 (+) comp16570_c0_seq2:169-465(+)
MNSLNLNFQSVVDTNCWLPERFVGDDSAGFWGFSMTDAIIVFHDKLTYVRKALSSTPELSVSFSTVVAVSPEQPPWHAHANAAMSNTYDSPTRTHSYG